MKKLISVFVLTIMTALIAKNVSAQVTLDISKSISSEDYKRIETILRNFDQNSFKLSVNVSGGEKSFKAGNNKRSLGLANVEQTYTKNNMKNAAASTVNTINIFKSAKASTVNTINIFKASTVNTINIFKASTVNTINIFKPTDSQLSKMDELHAILSQYK